MRRLFALEQNPAGSACHVVAVLAQPA